MVLEGLWFLKDLLRENTLTHTRLCPSFDVGILKTCLCAWIVSGERDWKSQRVLPSNPQINIFLSHLPCRPSQESLRRTVRSWIQVTEVERDPVGLQRQLSGQKVLLSFYNTRVCCTQVRQLPIACNSRSKGAPFRFTWVPTLRWNIHTVITHLKISNHRFYKTHIHMKASLGPWKGSLQ